MIYSIEAKAHSSSSILMHFCHSFIMNEAHRHSLNKELENAIHYIKVEIKNLIQTGNIIFGVLVKP